MGLITLNVASVGNRAPSSSGWLLVSLDYNTTHTFSVADFTTNTNPEYIDPDGDPFGSVQITSLPSQGILKLLGAPVNQGDIITSAQLLANEFTYESDASDLDGYTDSNMKFLVSDDNSAFYTTPQACTFEVGYDETVKNQAPSVVGDGQADLSVGETFVFTRASLTSQLNPPYEDPEGNPAYKLLIVSVPVYGNLFLDGSLVVEGQEILFTDIDSGDLAYTAEEFPSEEIEGFEFQISDTISQQYTG